MNKAGKPSKQYNKWLVNETRNATKRQQRRQRMYFDMLDIDEADFF